MPVGLSAGIDPEGGALVVVAERRIVVHPYFGLVLQVVTIERVLIDTLQEIVLTD
jgi:hypothetical protein